MFLAEQSGKLLEKLGTWRDHWMRAMQKSSNDDHKWLGVAKNVPDLEYLSRRIIEVAVSPEAGLSSYLHRIPSTDTRELHEFIHDFISKK